MGRVSRELGGEAAQNTWLTDDRTVYGYYVFPSAQPGATSFTFHDDDLHVQIEGITLQYR